MPQKHLNVCGFWWRAKMWVLREKPLRTEIKFVRNWPLPTGAFQGQWNNWNELSRLRIPTGRRQTSWLCTSVAEELNQGLPQTNSENQTIGFEPRTNWWEVRALSKTSTPPLLIITTIRIHSLSDLGVSSKLSDLLSWSNWAIQIIVIIHPYKVNNAWSKRIEENGWHKLEFQDVN